MKIFDNIKKLFIQNQTIVKTIMPNTKSKKELTKEQAPLEQSIGYYSFMNILPNPDKLLKAESKDQTAYEELLTDGHLYGAVAGRKAGTTSLEWEIVQDQSTPKETEEIQKIFQGLDIYSTVDSILNSVYYGYKIIEITWEYLGNIIIPTILTTKPNEWFVFDAENNLRFLSKTSPYKGEIMNPDKFLIPKYEATYTNPYGNPLLSKCYWNIFFKKRGKEFWATFSENFGTPWLLAEYLQSLKDTEVDELMVDLQNMFQNGIMAHPNNMKLSIANSGSTSNADLYDKFINDSRIENSIAVLGHTGSTMSTPGKLGNENTAEQAKKYLIDSDKRLVEETMNILIKKIHKFNYTGIDYPKFKFFEEEDVQMDLATRDTELVNQGLEFEKEYYSDIYKIDPKYIKSVNKPQPAPTPKEPEPETGPEEEKTKAYWNNEIDINEYMLFLKSEHPALTTEELELKADVNLQRFCNG